MTDSRIQVTKTKLARVYGAGLLVFAAIVGTVTVVAVFLSRLNFP